VYKISLIDDGLIGEGRELKGGCNTF